MAICTGNQKITFALQQLGSQRADFRFACFNGHRRSGNVLPLKPGRDILNPQLRQRALTDR
jgi:hypothetical protein